MTFLLCPECCQWREPVEGRCPACAATLDVAVPDPSLETIADEVGELQGLLGEANVSRSHLPKRGRLLATSSGLLFVPSESRVIVFGTEGNRAVSTGDGSPLTPCPAPQRGEGKRLWFFRGVSLIWSRVMRRAPAARFACESRTSDPIAHDRLALAELLRGDPGVLFWSRAAIASWRRERGQWELISRSQKSWPERIAMRDRDGDRALQNWLETTECPLPVNAR